MILIKALREIAYAIGVFFIAAVLGNIIYMVASDYLITNADHSRDAAIGFGALFAIVVLIVHIIRRIVKSRKRAAPAAG